MLSRKTLSDLPVIQITKLQEPGALPDRYSMTQLQVLVIYIMQIKYI